MKKNLKVYLHNDKSDILNINHRPFYSTNLYDIQITQDIENSDFILIKESDYLKVLNDANMKKYLEKIVFYTNSDNPTNLLRDKNTKKFIGQPLQREEFLKKMNVNVMPLIMTDHKNIHFDREFIEKCRNQEKVYDYFFIGQISYGNRRNMFDLNLKNSKIEVSKSIYNLNKEEKIQKIKEFLLELSKAKFAFAPRGVGSSSFRLCESLMVGTVPIATDVISFPFEDEVMWDEFSIIGSLDNPYELIEKTKKISDYNLFRKKGIEFWEDYCKLDNMYDKLITKIIKNE